MICPDCGYDTVVDLPAVRLCTREHCGWHKSKIKRPRTPQDAAHRFDWQSFTVTREPEYIKMQVAAMLRHVVETPVLDYAIVAPHDGFGNPAGESVQHSNWRNA